MQDDFEVNDQDIEECYGSICNVKVQALVDSKGCLSDEILGLGSERARFFNVVNRSGSTFVLKSRDGPEHNDIAVINSRSSIGLLTIAFLPSIRLEAVFMKTLRQPEVEDEAKKPLVVFTVTINLYGPPNDAAHVGRLLSDSKLFLQRPFYQSRGVPYNNPHWLSYDDLAIERIELNDSAEEGECSEDDSRSVNVQEVLDSIPRVESLTEREVDTILVNTPLKSHQKEAFDFMLKKEEGVMPLSSRLWKEEVSDSGTTSYRHKITRTTSHTLPNEPKSGLIADEMGLGKSLTALALIVSSLDRARLFEEQGNHYLSAARATTHTTLVVVPYAIMIDEWLDEINSHLPENSLKVHRYHGRFKEIDHIKLKSFDVILTTYATVETDYRLRRFLSSINWFRIVFDEAHTIRNSSTKQYKAASVLSGEYKWCLTGTPIQNKVEDLEALVKVLQIPLLDQSVWFNSAVLRPINQQTKPSFDNLRCLLSSMCLRRTRHMAGIPDPEELPHLISPTAQEKDADEKMIDDFKMHIDRARQVGDTEKVRKLVLRLILRRRIFCNTGAVEKLDLDGQSEDIDLEERLTLLQQNDEANCNQCLGDIFSLGDEEDWSGIFFNCGHLLCIDCKPQGQSNDNQSRGYGGHLCPACAQDHIDCGPQKGSAHSNSKSNPNITGQIPSKLSKVIEDILKHKGKAKSLIFSCWVKSLDMLAAIAEKHNITFTRLDGSMTPEKRQKSRQVFEKDPNIDAMLVTIGTGALGLNVLAANRIHILEPQWNPAMENQAIGRAVRMNQLREVVVVRYIVRGSIEELNVKSRQHDKIKLATGGFGKMEGEDQEEHLQRQIDFATWRSNSSSN